jgi:hypothetical protein
MNESVLLVVGLAVCFGAAFLLIGVGGVLIYLVGKKAVGPMRQRQLESLVENEVHRRGYELLDLADVRSRDHPFVDRFGFGKVAGVVKEIEVRDRAGATRRGWVFIRARIGPGGTYSGYRTDSLEIAWEKTR